MTPTEVVDRQLAAYHARDIAAFAETYAPDIQIWEAGQHGPAMVGREGELIQNVWFFEAAE